MRYQTPSGLKMAIISASVIAPLLTGVVYTYQKNAVYTHSPALPSKISAVQAKPATAGGETSTPSSVTVVATKPQTAPNCTPVVSRQTPSAPAIVASQPGLHQLTISSTSYTVYGMSTGQINGQIYTCSPVRSGTERFAASTDYAINWTFSFQSDGKGQCVIKGASVGLNIIQVFPAWQAVPGTQASLTGKWQTFITNLHTHEAGHAALDASGATTILQDLQNFPATNCDTLDQQANAKAQQDIYLLEQANTAYDAANGHGATQGAIL